MKNMLLKQNKPKSDRQVWQVMLIDRFHFKTEQNIKTESGWYRERNTKGWDSSKRGTMGEELEHSV